MNSYTLIVESIEILQGISICWSAKDVYCIFILKKQSLIWSKKCEEYFTKVSGNSRESAKVCYDSTEQIAVLCKQRAHKNAQRHRQLSLSR
jgi:hypothetical protein